MAISGDDQNLGQRLAKLRLFGSPSDDLPVERTDCVSVALARSEHYRSPADLWQQLYGRGLPDNPLEPDQIQDLLNRTGTRYQCMQFDSVPSGQSAFEALYAAWKGNVDTQNFRHGLLFYTRQNTCGHCVNFINLAGGNEMLFIDFQTLRWAQDFKFAAGVDCWRDVSVAETIVMMWDTQLDRFLGWEHDPNERRLVRVRNMIKDGYKPLGPPPDYPHAHRKRFFTTYRYSSREILSQLVSRPPWAMLREEADLLRDVGILNVRGRLQVRKWPARPVVDVDGEEIPVSLRYEDVTKWRDVPYETRRDLARYFAQGYTGVERERIVEAFINYDPSHSPRIKLHPDFGSDTMTELSGPSWHSKIQEVIGFYHMDHWLDDPTFNDD